MSRPFTRIVPLSVMGALLALAGCASGPHPMPSGYSHHNMLYKAPPGAEAKPPRGAKKVQQAPVVPMQAPADTGFYEMEGAYFDAPAPAQYTQAVATQEYRMAADDLIARTEKNFGRLSEPVLVRAPASHDAGEGAFAAALQQVLETRNYRVTTASGDSAYTLGYQIDRNQFDAPDRAMATLNVHVMESIAWQESGIYTLPLSTFAHAAAPSLNMPPKADEATVARPARLTDPVEAQYVLPKMTSDEPRMAGGDMRGSSTAQPGVEVFAVD